MGVRNASADVYTHQLEQLLPIGPAWPREGDSPTARAFPPVGAALAAANRRVNLLIDEADPRTTTELLVDWERVLGLPDDCVADLPLSIGERRRLAWAKLIETGGQSRAYFIALAEQYGEPGLKIYDGFRPMTCNDGCNDALYSEADRFVWQVRFNHSATNARPMNCNDSCNDALQIYSRSLAECPLSERKPAHTNLIFSYQAAPDELLAAIAQFVNFDTSVLAT